MTDGSSICNPENYRPHPDTQMSVRINNAIHMLNLNRRDIAALPDGATIAVNITTQRILAVLLEDLRP